MADEIPQRVGDPQRTGRRQPPTFQVGSNAPAAPQVVHTAAPGVHSWDLNDIPRNPRVGTNTPNLPPSRNQPASSLTMRGGPTASTTTRGGTAAQRGSVAPRGGRNARAASSRGGRPQQRSQSSGSTRPKGRNIQAELTAKYGTPDQLAAQTSDFDQVYLKVISPKTKQNHASATRLWLAYFTWALGSEEVAESTLEKGAALPKLPVFLQFLHHCAESGRSLLGLEGVTGWSMRSTFGFASCVLGMLHQRQVETPTEEYREQITKAIQKWSKEDKILTTERKPKYSLRETEHINLLAMFLNADVAYQTQFQRVQMSAICTLLYEMGSRVGQFVLSDGFDHKAEIDHETLCWDHVEWWITDYNTNTGLIWSAFFTFHYMKGMRAEKGLKTFASIKSLPSNLAHIDAFGPLIALAIHQKVFEEDLLSWILHPEKMPKVYPYRLTIRSQFQSKAVFVLPTHHERALTYSSFRFQLSRAAKALGWKYFTSRCYRYAWAGHMAGKLPRAIYNYLLGHRYTSNMGKSVYQAPDRNRDVASIRHGLSEDTTFSDLHSSIASTATHSAGVLSESDRILINSDSELQAAIALWIQNSDLVFNAHGMDVHEAVKQGITDELVDSAMESWTDVLMRYNNIVAVGTESYQTNINATNFQSFSSHSGGPSAPLPKSTLPLHVNSLNRHSISNARISTTSEVVDGMPATIADRISSTLHELEQLHPLIPIISEDPSKSHTNILLHFLARLQQDDLEKQFKCVWCHGDASLQDDIRTRNHGNKRNLALHKWTCENTRNQNQCMRCNLCGSLVPRSFDLSDYEDSQPPVFDYQLDTHFDTCYLDFLTDVISTTLAKNCARQSEDQLSDSDTGIEDAVVSAEDQDEALSANGPLRFSRRVPLGSGNLTKLDYFCPLCIFDPYREWHARLVSFMGPRHVSSHIISHGSHTGGGPSSFDLERRFICSVPDCTKKNQSLLCMDFFNHYHNDHHYDLLQCMQDHEHPQDEELLLTGNAIFYAGDIPILDELRLHNPSVPQPSVAIVENHRRKSARERAHNALQTRYGQ